MRYVEITHKPLTAETTNPSLLEVAYLVFLQERIVRSQWEFSQRILGKAHSYLSSMRARGREPRIAVLQRLLKQTRLVLARYEENPQLDNPHAEGLNRSHRRFVALANTIGDELNWRTGLSFDPPVDVNPPPPCQ